MTRCDSSCGQVPGFKLHSDTGRALPYLRWRYLFLFYLLLRLNLVEYLNAVVQIIAEASPPFCRSTFSFIINQLHETRFRAATGSAFEPLPRPTFYYPFNLCSPGLQPAWGYEKWYAQGIEIRLMPEVYTNAKEIYKSRGSSKRQGDIDYVDVRVRMG